VAPRTENLDGDVAAALAHLAAELRAAVACAIAANSSLASMLDSCRSEVERIRMLGDVPAEEVRRVLGRCRMVLGAWRAISPRPAAPAVSAVDGTACVDCGAVAVRDVVGPGRRVPYEGIVVAVPASFPIPTCGACGAEQLDDETAKQLDGLLATEYLSRRY
jgi:hypothetical protein